MANRVVSTVVKKVVGSKPRINIKNVPDLTSVSALAATAVVTGAISYSKDSLLAASKQVTEIVQQRPRDEAVQMEKVVQHFLVSCERSDAHLPRHIRDRLAAVDAQLPEEAVNAMYYGPAFFPAPAPAPAPVVMPFDFSQPAFTPIGRKSDLAMAPPPPPPQQPAPLLDEDGKLLPVVRQMVQGVFINRMDISLANSPALPLTDEQNAQIRADLGAIVDRCAPSTCKALHDQFVDVYGKSTRNNLIFLHGAAGTGKTTLADAMLEKLKRPTLNAQSLEELLSPDFIMRLVRTMAEYGRSDLAVRVNEATLGRNPEATVKLFLNTCERDGFFQFTFHGIEIKLDLVVFFIANLNFLDDPSFEKVTGEKQAGYARVKAIEVRNEAPQRADALTGTIDEMADRKLRDKAAQLRGLVRDLGMSETTADEQWTHARSVAKTTVDMARARFPDIEKAGNLGYCTMGVMRDGAKDLYSRMEKRVDAQSATTPSALKDVLWIHRTVAKHMKAPPAPPALEREIAFLADQLDGERAPVRPASDTASAAVAHAPDVAPREATPPPLVSLIDDSVTAAPRIDENDIHRWDALLGGLDI